MAKLPLFIPYLSYFPSATGEAVPDRRASSRREGPVGLGVSSADPPGPQPTSFERQLQAGPPTRRNSSIINHRQPSSPRQLIQPSSPRQLSPREVSAPSEDNFIPPLSLGEEEEEERLGYRLQEGPAAYPFKGKIETLKWSREVC
jgi:hypothetical protein